MASRIYCHFPDLDEEMNQPEPVLNYVDSHLAILIHFVVGQLHLLERHHLLPQRLTADRAVGVRVEAGRWRRIGLASDQPR